jgi:integrase
MFHTHRKGTSLNEIVGYTLPKLHSGKTWYVDFLCYDPVEQKMRRKKFMLDSIKKVSDRKKRASEIIATVSSRLSQGWNPWADVSNSRQYSTFDFVIQRYTDTIHKMVEHDTIKQKTCYDYLSRLNMLIEYNQSRKNKVIYMYQFDQCFVSDFLDYILLDRDSSARTRNNYRCWLSAFTSWLIEKKYIEVNPVENIHALPERQKFRTSLQNVDLKRLRDYLSGSNKYYLLACQMEYYTFIRPNELSNIQLKDIHLKEQKIFVSSTISKNRRDGMVGLNDELCRLMIELEIFSHPDNFYLFGEDFRPSANKADSRIFRDTFVKVRKALKFPPNYQFYSLKDSGIRDLANAKGIVIARDQARHTDIATTNKYLTSDALSVHEETKHFEGLL